MRAFTSIKDSTLATNSSSFPFTRGNLWRTFLCLTVCLTTVRNSQAAQTPEELVQSMNKAIASRDIAQAKALVNWGDAPVMAYRFFQMSIADCFEAPCKISVGPIAAENKIPQAGFVWAAEPEGELNIVPADGNGNLALPYAKVGGEYKIVMTSFTPESVAGAKAAADPMKLAEEVDANLLKSGTALPSDGGDPAKAYRDYLSAVARADGDYITNRGTMAERYLFGSYVNKPEKRAIAIELAKLENIVTPEIKAGYTANGRALLLVTGKNGQGWNSAGAILLEQKDGKWQMEDRSMASYPVE